MTLAHLAPLIECRADWLCEVCRTERHAHLHHRKRRSQGGPNTMENLLAVCSYCHDKIHANPKWAYDKGLMIRGADEITPYVP